MAKTKDWKDQAAQLGIGTLVVGLKAIRSGISKRKYKRLLATAVAQLLATHPDLGPGQARRRAQWAARAKPSKKLLVKPKSAGLKESIGTAAVAAASGAALKAAGRIGQKVVAKLEQEAPAERETAAR
jgi:hypothetical protein